MTEEVHEPATPCDMGAMNPQVDQDTICTGPFHSKSYRAWFLVPFAQVTGGLIAIDEAATRELNGTAPGSGFDVGRGGSYSGSAWVNRFLSAFCGFARITHNERDRETG